MPTIQISVLLLDGNMGFENFQKGVKKDAIEGAFKELGDNHTQYNLLSL